VISCVHGFPKEVVGVQMNDDEERHALLAIQTQKQVAVNDLRLSIYTRLRQTFPPVKPRRPAKIPLDAFPPPAYTKQDNECKAYG
jgi:hypothetical protein